MSPNPKIIYLLGFYRGPGEESERKRSSIACSFPRWLKHRSGPAQSHGLGARNSGLVSHTGARASVIEPSAVALPGTLVGTWNEGGGTRIWTSTHMKCWYYMCWLKAGNWKFEYWSPVRVAGTQSVSWGKTTSSTIFNVWSKDNL